MKLPDPGTLYDEICFDVKNHAESKGYKRRRLGYLFTHIIVDMDASLNKRISVSGYLFTEA